MSVTIASSAWPLPVTLRGRSASLRPEKRILVAGDQILAKITPNIQSFADGENPLQDFLVSLERISKLDVELVLPGHRNVITDHQTRIEELKNHHYNRAQAVRSILRRGAQNAYEIASQMDWDLSLQKLGAISSATKMVCHRRGDRSPQVSGREESG